MLQMNPIKVAAAGLMLLVLMGGSTGCSRSEAADTTDKLFEVRRSDLSIGSLLRGTANAKEKHKLFPEASFRNRLTWIEEENTYVHTGDVVIRFEKQDLLDDIESRKLDLESRIKQLEIRKEEMRILLSENEASLRVAQDRVKSAEESYARYYKYDGKKAKDDAELNVFSREEALDKAMENYRSKLDEISNTIYDDEDQKNRALNELENLKGAVDSAEQAYEAAKFSRKIFKKYTYPNTLTDRKNQLEQAQLNLSKEEVSTESRVIQKEQDINRLANEIDRLQKDLERIEGYLPLMEITAPVDGILIYGDPDNTRNRNNQQVEIGQEYNRNRVIATIPEMDNLVINFDIPEQFRHRITEGAKVIVTPDSIPTLKLTGMVSNIAMVPVYQISWDQTSPKVYNATIVLDEQNEKLVSGMNVQVEIIDEVLEDVVNVPVESVFEEEGAYFVYLKDGGKIRKQVIEIGKSNDQYVHVSSGLDVGDYIFLYSPYKLDASE